MVIKTEKRVVYAAPINDATLIWGVYCLPRMWRKPDGELTIRINGEQDCPDKKTASKADTLYFCSSDKGKTWRQTGEKQNFSYITGISAPVLSLKNGKKIAFKNVEGLKPIVGIREVCRFEMPNKEGIYKAYRYGDIPKDAKGLKMVEFDSFGNIVWSDCVDMGFPEREVFVVAYPNVNGKYIKRDEYLLPMPWSSPYMSSLTEYDEKTLLALTTGQNPLVNDRYCPDVYVMESTDKGKTWRKRGTVANGFYMPNGYSGDGTEVSMCKTCDGTLICVMRMEMSVTELHLCDTMMARSFDGGFTWLEPVSVAESSVTPHIVALKNGIVVLIYGRPGVHFKYSLDNGKTFSESTAIIGETLSEKRARGISDAVSKYGDMDSYSNTFVEVVGDDSLLVVYNDMKYDTGDGKNHKATMVAEIKLCI